MLRILSSSKIISYIHTNENLEPFTDLTFPKENILPEEKKILGFMEKISSTRGSASQHVSMLVCSSLTLHELADIHEAPIASSIEKKILRATVYIQLMTGC